MSSRHVHASCCRLGIFVTVCSIFAGAVNMVLASILGTSMKMNPRRAHLKAARALHMPILLECPEARHHMLHVAANRVQHQVTTNTSTRLRCCCADCLLLRASDCYEILPWQSGHIIVRPLAPPEHPTGQHDFEDVCDPPTDA